MAVTSVTSTRVLPSHIAHSQLRENLQRLTLDAVGAAPRVAIFA